MILPENYFTIYHPDSFKKGIAIAQSPVLVVKKECTFGKEVPIKIDHKKSLEKSRPKIHLFPERD